MQHVLIDACGWVACVDANLNTERELEAVLGPCVWVLLESVEKELERLEANRKKSKPLLLDLLRAKSVTNRMFSGKHADDDLFRCALDNQWATLTVDTALKRRLYEANLRIVEVRQNSHLYLVDSL